MQLIDPLNLPIKPLRPIKGFTFQYRLERCEAMTLHERQCDTPEKAADYWYQTVTRSRLFNRDRECFVVLLLSAVIAKAEGSTL